MSVVSDTTGSTHIPMITFFGNCLFRLKAGVCIIHSTPYSVTRLKVDNDPILFPLQSSALLTLTIYNISVCCPKKEKAKIVIFIFF